MLTRPNARLLARILLAAPLAWPAIAFAQEQLPTTSAEVVVSATKANEAAVDVPGSVVVVTGEEIRRSGVRTLGDALQDVVGVESGSGADDGPRRTNVGMWGLKEFDALLFMVDGVPIGGPFNPSLAQIPIEDIDRIEIAKGPQGTLWGVSAFAGMVQVFTKRPEERSNGSVRVTGGSFSNLGTDVSYATRVGGDTALRLSGAFERGQGWQDRTDLARERLAVSLQRSWGASQWLVSVGYTRDSTGFGSPLPVDGGVPLPGFDIDRNYAVRGARLDHRIFNLSSNFSTPLRTGLTLENTLGVTRDEQKSIRSFVGETDGVTAEAAGVSLSPKETVVFDDLRAVGEFEALGKHRLVAGAALTWGRTTAAGIGFDLDMRIGPNPSIPEVGALPVGDNRSFTDRRTFFGVYVNDEWTPTPRLTFSAGARYDSTSETLHARQQEVGDPRVDTANDSRSDAQWSGGVSALFRILEKPAGVFDTANVYVSLRSNFKPAAPNLSEAESARILDPERTRAGEIGLKTLFLAKRLSFNVALFHMNFENLVVSNLGPGGIPVLLNAGEQRFQGAELDFTYRPAEVPGLAFSGGYAHHDATFVRFSFLTPDGQLRVVDGKRLELSPRDLWNLRLGYSPEHGLGGFVAIRHQNQRPLNRRNRFYTPGFEEWDAGVSCEFDWGRVTVVGRNLGDSRHYVNESEIGDSQFHVAPPRRVTADVTFRF